MYTIRQNKISRLLQKELAEIFQLEGRENFRGKLISVSVVRISKDLSVARVYLSIFPSESSGEVIKRIKELTSYIRGHLGRKVGMQLRIIPALEFFVDDSLDYIENIDRLLKE